MFSKSCEYAIKATIYIAEQSLKGEIVGQKAIVKAINSPEAFTAKTLQILTKSNVISSNKGPKGGFFLDESQLKKTYLSNIVSVVDGDEIYKGCGLGLKMCNEKQPCPVKEMLETTTVEDLAVGLKSGLSFLKQ